jgi:biotin carboxyl carrier protein
MDYRYQIGGETFAVRVEKSGAGYIVTVNGRAHAVSAAQRRGDVLTFRLDGEPRTAFVAADGPRRWVAFDSQPTVLTLPQNERRARRGKTAGHDSLEAQMPGLVRRVLAAEGERVERGQALLVLEAMKMEIKVNAPHAGVVEKVAVQEGETVQRGQLLIELAE